MGLPDAMHDRRVARIARGAVIELSAEVDDLHVVSFWKRRLFRTAYKTRALTLLSLSRADQQADQLLGLGYVCGLCGDASRVHGREFAARRQRTGQHDTLGADDLSRLRAADWTLCVRIRQFTHGGRAVRENPEPGSDLVSDAKLRKDFCDVNPGRRGYRVRHEDRIRCQQALAQLYGILDRDRRIASAYGECCLYQANICD